MMDLERTLHELSDATQRGFQRRNAVLSFPAYLKMLQARPAAMTRGAARYLVDAIEQAGVREVGSLGHSVRRFAIFDDPGATPETSAEVFGQEDVQARLYEILSEFARRGRPDRFVLLHGPNGSAKSSLIEALVRGLERYSQTEAGALFRFSWIFCEAGERDRLGFQPGRMADDLTSLAEVDERLISSRIPCELKDPPWLLIPRELRREFFEAALREAPDSERSRFQWTDAVLDGDLSPKARTIHDALLKAYGGDWSKVVRHVRVERFDISRRYRTGAVTIEPQVSVDARARMIGHASMAGLPPVLQHEVLSEAFGDLIDANAGLVEFSDFFKRPIEVSKYLLTTAERGVLNLEGYTAHLNLVLVGTTNEKYLAAFKRDPSFASFKGRFEFVRVPYLVEASKEACIYARHLSKVRGERHVAPHTAEVIGLWAVLTRLRRPNPSRYPAGVQAAIRKLTPIRKAKLYDRGELPSVLTEDEQKLLHAEIDNLRAEFDGQEEEVEGEIDASYEGRAGASPREILALLSDFAVGTARPCISPVDIFEGLPVLLRDKTLHRFLRMEKDGAYHDPEGFIADVRADYIHAIAREVQRASDLVDEVAYRRLFHDYFRHVKAYDTRDRVANLQTGALEPPDEALMAEVEKHLDLHEPADRFRRDLMMRIAVFRIENPTSPIVFEELFGTIFRALRDRTYAEHRARLFALAADALEVRAGVTDQLTPDRRSAAAHLERRLVADFGYCAACAGEMLSWFVRSRDEPVES